LVRLALLLLFGASHRPDGILLMRDDDRQSERLTGFQQARDWARNHLPELGPIVIGLAHLKRECWVLVGFVPATGQERQIVESLRQQLSFHPCDEPERLTGRHNEARDAKRVLRILTGDNRDREAICWEQTPLSELERRGASTGLTAFLNEVRTLLIPLFRNGR
jgi:hypothetical protein